MSKVSCIYNYIDRFAPFYTAMSFDNVGLMVGDMDAKVTKAMLALDVTDDVVNRAVRENCQLIISHHPVIFQPLKNLKSSSLPYKLAANGISVISAHTNYDLSPCGVNYHLAKTIGLKNIRPFLIDENGCAEGIMGDFCANISITPKEFAKHVKDSLNAGGVSYTEGKSAVKTVAVGCGAGSYTLNDAVKAGCNAFVTGESKHHEQLAAVDMGITLVTAGHFSTENIAMKPLCDILSEKFSDVKFILAEQSEPVKYL